MRSLRGLSVWVTRTEASGTGDLWRQHGANVHLEPLVELEPRPPRPEQAKAWATRDPQFGLVFTSAHAVQALIDWAPDPIEPTVVYAVGDVTAAAAAREGWPAPIVAGGGTGAAMAQSLATRRDLPSCLVFPCSEQRRPETVEALAGVANLVELNLYRPRPRTPSSASRAFLTNRNTIVALYSPSAAEALAAVTVEISCCALGESTAAAARTLGLSIVAVGDPPAEKNMVEATARWWAQSS